MVAVASCQLSYYRDVSCKQNIMVAVASCQLSYYRDVYCEQIIMSAIILPCSIVSIYARSFVIKGRWAPCPAGAMRHSLRALFFWCAPAPSSCLHCKPFVSHINCGVHCVIQRITCGIHCQSYQLWHPVATVPLQFSFCASIVPSIVRSGVHIAIVAYSHPWALQHHVSAI